MLAKPQIHLDVALLQACQHATVIAASERVKSALLHAYDAYHAGLGLRTWRSARVVTLGAYLKQRHDDLLRTSRSNQVLLGAHAQRLAWLDHAPESNDMDFDAIYDDIATAWQIIHDWDLLGSLHQLVDNDNHRLLRDWGNRYRHAARRRRWLTEAELPGRIAAAVRSRQLPAESTVFIGFDIIAPSLARLINALRGSGGSVSVHALGGTHTAQRRSVTCEDPEQELDNAIIWARDILHAAAGPVAIGIAVPDVIAQYDRIVRQLESGLRPANRNPDPALCPYNISAGIPLAAMPVVAAALKLLQWLLEPIHHFEVESLLRSPFLSLQAVAPHSQNVNLPESYDAAELANRLASSPLHGLVGRVNRRRSAPLAEAIAQMKGTFESAGWPNIGNLTSESFQAYHAMLDLLDELASAGSVVRSHNFGDAFAIVRNAARRSLFAPARPHAPLQVLGYLETANLQFTHLWVVGLSDLTWPGPARPNVYIPLRLLRAARMPRIDADSELAFARRLTEHWRTASEHVVFSSPRVIDESSGRMSRLVDDAPAHLAGTPYPHSHPFLTRNPGVALEIRNEPLAGLLAVQKLRHHGSQILRDQSACPFRAFARYRLHATQPPLPHSFFDAIDRGVVTHLALHEAYERIGQSGGGAAIADSQIESIVTVAVTSALSGYGRFPQSFLEAERKRLAALVLEWLRFEQGRLPGRLIASERATTLTLGSLAFQLQVDRIDELDDGGTVVIDYKTGTSNASAVFGERPEEPQLAMYALGVSNVQAIAFARVKHDDCRVVGWSNPARQKDGATTRHLRPPPPDQSWEDVLDSWRSRLTHLCNEFTGGVADVSPRNADACRQCDLHALCRIREFIQPGGDGFDR